jgi:hypothetical protein
MRRVAVVAAGFVWVALFTGGCEAGDGAAAAGDGGVDSRSSALSGFERPGTVAPDSDLATPPDGSLGFWVMGDEWREDVHPPLYRGAQARFTVVPERVAQCGPGAAVTAFFRPDVGEPFERALVQESEGAVYVTTFPVPERARSLELWLRVVGADGCVAWDSDFGSNYRVPVHVWAPTLVRFPAGGTPVVEGPIVRGTVLVVDYAVERLPHCRVIYRGFPGWDIIAHASFDGVEVPGHSVLLSPSYPPSGSRARALAFFPVPWEARNLSLWFENNQYPPTCHDWDSNGGANYTFRTTDPAVLAAAPGARLVFGEDWREWTTGPLYAGATLTIEARAARFPTCGLRGAVLAGVRTDTGAQLAVPLADESPAGGREGYLVIPEDARALQLWLQVTAADGCDEYDSDFGANYGFDVQVWGD